MAKSNSQRSLFSDEEEPVAPPDDSSLDLPVAQPSQSIVPVDGNVPLAGKTIYALDISLLMFQYFHAIPQMTSPRGQPTNCVFGLTRDLIYLIEDRHADGIVCAFDLPGKTFRDELFPKYKAERPTTPDELIAQFPLVERLLDALRIPRLGVPGFEADDILATVAAEVTRGGGTCLLVTLDKDCRQLISDRVRLFDPRKHEEMGAAELRDLWGIEPGQVVDYQALVGDPVDNVPGVPLIGPKIASQYLRDFGSLDGLYERLSEIPKGKRRDNLEQARESVRLSRDLVRLRNDIPMSFAWPAGSVASMDFIEGAAVARELGFRKFTEVFRRRAGVGGEPDRTAGSMASIRVVEDPAQITEIAGAIRQAGRVAVSLLADHPHPRFARWLGAAFAWNDEAVFFPAELAGAGELTEEAPLRRLWSALFSDEAVGSAARGSLGASPPCLIGHDVKFDAILLRGLGLDFPQIGCDVLVAGFLLDSGTRDLQLASLAQKYSQPDFEFPEELLTVAHRDPALRNDARLPILATQRARVALHVAEVVERRIVESGLDSLFRDLELALIPVLADMEYRGILVDAERLRTLSKEFERRLATLEGDIHALAGHPFNIASPKQLATVLFEELKLPVVKKTKTGPSTDVEVLEQLAAGHALPAKVIEYRHFAKLKGTYVDALPALIHPVTGRIHTSFNQVVAATGRLSSLNPNLQNIPTRSESGHEIRSAFIAPPPDGRLLAADYSQIELRVLAHFSQDPSLLAAFAVDEDIHARVASEIQGIPVAEVTSAMRRTAKAVNFGVIYGQSAFGLAKSLGIEQAEATRFIDAYFQRYSGIVRFMDEILDRCQLDGCVRTIAGRRRPIDGVRPARERSIQQRSLPERTAINSVIQGSAADLMKAAMIRVDRRNRREGGPARLLLQIHDELLFEVDSKDLAGVGSWVREEMEKAMALSVPLRVDVKSGLDWANCEKWG